MDVLPFRMERIVFTVPQGTKAWLRQINPNISALMRKQVRYLLERSGGSVYDKAEGLCGVSKGGPNNAATSKNYLKQYGPKRSRALSVYSRRAARRVTIP